jgi:hypothetical protein
VRQDNWSHDHPARARHRAASPPPTPRSGAGPDRGSVRSPEATKVNPLAPPPVRSDRSASLEPTGGRPLAGRGSWGPPIDRGAENEHDQEAETANPRPGHAGEAPSVGQRATSQLRHRWTRSGCPGRHRPAFRHLGCATRTFARCRPIPQLRAAARRVVGGWPGSHRGSSCTLHPGDDSVGPERPMTAKLTANRMN